MREKKQVVFICSGNICRSPLAQGVFEDLVSREELSDKVHIDSAGTSAWHEGEPADSRMRKTARQRGIFLNSRARQFLPSDFDCFDLVLAMDHSNFQQLKRLRPERDLKDKLFLFRSFDPKNRGNLDVPDPYYGGDHGFQTVFAIVDRTCPKLLNYIKTRFSIPS